MSNKSEDISVLNEFAAYVDSDSNKYEVVFNAVMDEIKQK